MDRVHRGGPWTGSMGWSMDRVHRGGPWTRVHVLYTSDIFWNRTFQHLNLSILIYQGTTQEKARPFTPPVQWNQVFSSLSKSIKFLAERKVAMGNQRFTKVKGGKAKGAITSAVDQGVLIFIGLLEWNEKENALKPKRGKKVAL